MGRASRERASDGEREAVVEQLRSHHLAGRIEADELETRVGQAYGARTIGELTVALRDLPIASTRRIGVPARLRTPSRRHLSGFSLFAILNIALVAAAIDGFMEKPHQIGSYVDEIAALGFSATCVWGAILGFRGLAPRRFAAGRRPRSLTS